MSKNNFQIYVLASCGDAVFWSNLKLNSIEVLLLYQFLWKKLTQEVFDRGWLVDWLLAKFIVLFEYINAAENPVNSAPPDW